MYFFPRKSKPLEGLKFVIGKTEKSKGEITKEIQSLGGHVTTKVSSDTAAVISCKGIVSNESALWKDYAYWVILKVTLYLHYLS
jgi:NAD-dependent DNA ligase